MGWTAFIAAALSLPLQRRWPFELITHFWPHLCAVLVLSGAVGLLARRRIAGGLHLAGGLALLGMLAAIRPTGSPGTAAGSEPAIAGELRGLYANVGPWNRDYERLIRLVAEEDPDVIGLAEIDGSWAEALAPLAARYPYRLEVPRPDAFGIGLLSRYPLSDTSSSAIAAIGIPTLQARVTAPDGAWWVVIAHPAVPSHGAAFAARNRLLRALSDTSLAEASPTVVLADLNATIWSPFMRDMARSGLRPVASGLRPLYTWPTFFPPLGLGLDHCLVSGDAIPLSFQVLPSIGSDHFPISCRVGRAVEASAGD